MQQDLVLAGEREVKKVSTPLRFAMYMDADFFCFRVYIIIATQQQLRHCLGIVQLDTNAYMYISPSFGHV